MANDTGPLGIELMNDATTRLRAEALQQQDFPVLSDGFVKVKRVWGSDAAVIEAARLTAQSEGRKPGEDENLIRYLMRHRHSTPSEFAGICLHVRIPMDAWRQWIRHRTASVNEFSTRYSPAIDEKDTTPAAEWRHQSKGNRQGSSGSFVEAYPDEFEVPADVRELMENGTPGEYLSVREHQLHEMAADVYNERREFGVANEQARKDLPLSTYTEAYWTCNLHNLLHFLGLRMDSHAQKEIRDYANIIGNTFVKQLFPATWRAFCDYRLKALTLNALDIQVLQTLHRIAATLNASDGRGLAGIPYSEEQFMAAQHPAWRCLTQCRERDECLAKLRRLGLVVTPD